MDSDLYHLRAIASEHIAKLIVESVQPDKGSLLIDSFLTDLLLQRYSTSKFFPKCRYSILQDGTHIPSMSAVELAIDTHAIRVIATSNYQHCIGAIWRGDYTIQYDDEGRLAFGQYDNLLSRRCIDHFDPQRMKGTASVVVINLVPLYQNIHNLCFTLLLMVFYTMTINKTDSFNIMDGIEWCMAVLVLGFFFDGVVKMCPLNAKVADQVDIEVELR